MYVSDSGLIQAHQESMRLYKQVSSVSSYGRCYMGRLQWLQTSYTLPCTQLTVSSSPEELVSPSSLSLSVSVCDPLSSSSSPSSSLSPNSPPLPASDPDWTERHGLLVVTETRVGAMYTRKLLILVTFYPHNWDIKTFIERCLLFDEPSSTTMQCMCFNFIGTQHRQIDRRTHT